MTHHILYMIIYDTAYTNMIIYDSVYEYDNIWQRIPYVNLSIADENIRFDKRHLFNVKGYLLHVNNVICKWRFHGKNVLERCVSLEFKDQKWINELMELYSIQHCI